MNTAKSTAGCDLEQQLQELWRIRFKRCYWRSALSGRCERFIGRVFPVGRSQIQWLWMAKFGNYSSACQHLLPRYTQNNKPATHTALRACRLPSMDQLRRRVGTYFLMAMQPLSMRLWWRGVRVEKEVDRGVSLPPMSPARWRHGHSSQGVPPNRVRFHKKRSHSALSSEQWQS